MNRNDINSYPSFCRLLKSRYSCRRFTSEPVGRDMLAAVIDAARLAPSACNRQPWVFLVADTPDLVEIAAASYSREWVKTAPAFIICCGLHEQAWHRQVDGKDHTDIDLAIAIEHMCLAAASLGLGTCWICNFDLAKIKEGFGLPEGVEPIAILPIGHPASDEIPEKQRKPISEIVRWGKY